MIFFYDRARARVRGASYIRCQKFFPPPLTLSPLASGIRVKNFWQTLYANGHFFAGPTKEEKKLVAVGRPSLAAISVGGRGRSPQQAIFILCTENGA
jgi:hypothetical protein